MNKKTKYDEKLDFQYFELEYPSFSTTNSNELIKLLRNEKGLEYVTIGFGSFLKKELVNNLLRDGFKQIREFHESNIDELEGRFSYPYKTAIDPLGKIILELRSGEIIIKEFESNILLNTIKMDNSIQDFTVSLNGKVLAVINYENLSFFNLENYEIITSMEIKSGYESISLSPDGKYLAGTTYNLTDLWSLAAMQIQMTILEGYDQVNFSLDSNKILLADAWHVKIFDLQQKKFHTEFDMYELRDQINSILNERYVANVFQPRMSPNGRYLFVGIDIVSSLTNESSANRNDELEIDDMSEKDENYTDEEWEYDKKSTEKTTNIEETIEMNTVKESEYRIVVIDIKKNINPPNKENYFTVRIDHPIYYISEHDVLHYMEYYEELNSKSLDAEFFKNKIKDSIPYIPYRSNDSAKNQKNLETFFNQLYEYISQQLNIETRILISSIETLDFNYVNSYGSPKVAVKMASLSIEDSSIPLIEKIFMILNEISMLKIFSIDLSNNNLTKIPNFTILELSLKKIDLSHNKITSIDYDLIVDDVNLSHNEISNLPANHFKRCRTLDLSYNLITTIENNVIFLTIEDENSSLNLSNNQLHEFNVEISSNKGNMILGSLVISHNYLYSIPQIRITSQYRTTEPLIVYMDLSYNRISQIDFALYDNEVMINALDLSFNLIREIELFQIPLKNLERIYLNNNQIQRLYVSNINQLRGLADVRQNRITKLRAIDLSNNSLNDISDIFYLVYILSLEQIDIEGNVITEKLASYYNSRDEFKSQFKLLMENKLVEKFLISYIKDNRIIYRGKYPIHEIQEYIQDKWKDQEYISDNISDKSVYNKLKSMIRGNQIFARIDAVSNVLILERELENDSNDELNFQICENCEIEQNLLERKCTNCQSLLPFCNICKSSFTPKAIRKSCPSCKNEFHLTHITEHININRACPICYIQLRQDDLI